MTQQSLAQQDVVIFDQRIIPPILFEQGPAVIPVESTLVCIEIKSKLTAAELRKAHDSARTVRSLYLHAGTRDQNGNWVPSVAAAVSSFLLALDTDLVLGGQKEAERYKNILGVEEPWISGICVAGRGYYFPTERVIYDRPTGTFFKEDHTPILRSWGQVCADGEHAEMLAFLSAVIQLMQRIGPSRGQPPLDAYFNKTEKSKQMKVRLISGPDTGKFVGLAESYESSRFHLNNVGYSYCDRQQDCGFPMHRAAELQAHLKTIGVETELVEVAEDQR